MTGPALPALSNRLAHLAEAAGEAARRGEAHKQARIAAHIEAGLLLAEARAEARFGEWGAVLARAGIHERTARDWMALAASGLKPATVADLGGMRAALASLRPGKSDADRIDIPGLGRVDPVKAAEAMFRFATEHMAARTARVDAESAGRVAVRREQFTAAVARLRHMRSRLRAAGLPAGREALLSQRLAAAGARLALLREETAALAAGTDARRTEADMIRQLADGEA